MSYFDHNKLNVLFYGILHAIFEEWNFEFLDDILLKRDNSYYLLIFSLQITFKGNINYNY
jgi:hypothetical protein